MRTLWISMLAALLGACALPPPDASRDDGGGMGMPMEGHCPMMQAGGTAAPAAGASRPDGMHCPKGADQPASGGSAPHTGH